MFSKETTMAVYRNANILLIFLILLDLIFISGTFVFFQKSYERMYERYSVKTDNLKQIESDLSGKYKTLQVAEKEIHAKIQTEEVTAEHYKEVLGTKQGLDEQIQTLEADIKKLNKDLTAQQSATADQKAKAQLAQTKGGELRSQIGQYNEDVRKLDTLMAIVQSEIEATRKKVASA